MLHISGISGSLGSFFPFLSRLGGYLSEQGERELSYNRGLVISETCIYRALLHVTLALPWCEFDKDEEFTPHKSTSPTSRPDSRYHSVNRTQHAMAISRLGLSSTLRVQGTHMMKALPLQSGCGKIFQSMIAGHE